MAQQKQRKQLILTDNQNISTYHFQPMQRLQRDFITDGIRIFMAQQKQRKQTITRLFLLTFSNQYNTYNIILRLMA